MEEDVKNYLRDITMENFEDFSKEQPDLWKQTEEEFVEEGIEGFGINILTFGYVKARFGRVEDIGD